MLFDIFYIYLAADLYVNFAIGYLDAIPALRWLNILFLCLSIKQIKIYIFLAPKSMAYVTTDLYLFLVYIYFLL